MTEAEAKSVIRKSVIKTKLGVSLTGLLALVMGVYLVANIFLQWEPMAVAMYVLSGIVGAVFIATGLACLYAAIMPDPLMKLIFSEPNQIAWVYTENIRLYSRPTQNVNLYIFSAGKKRHFLMSTQKNIAGLVEIVKTRAPHAHFGYDAEFERKFRSKP